MHRAFLAALAAVACSLPVSAQEQDPPPVMEELIAMPLQTPPWWTVSDADSEVHIVALPAWTPAGMEWDDTLLFETIKGARMVILPRKPLISVNDRPLPGRIGFNMWALPAVAMRGWGQLKQIQTRPPQMSPEHLDRLKALEVDVDEDDDKLNPTARAISLWFKTHERAGLARGEIEEQVEAFAEEHKVRVSEIPSYKISSLDWVIAQTRPADTACLAAALDEAELDKDEVRYAALAWARGRMKPLQELQYVRGRLRHGHHRAQGLRPLHDRRRGGPAAPGPAPEGPLGRPHPRRPYPRRPGRAQAPRRPQHQDQGVAGDALGPKTPA